MDLETLVSVCGGSTNDRKITCETLAADNMPETTAAAESDIPPGSFWLSKDAEFDWFDRNAFLERNESTKGNSNSGATNNSESSLHHKFVSNLISKAGILGLPKTQKTSYVADVKRRQCRLTNLFPKRPDSAGKLTTAISMAEPSSPKVSCMGKVRSKRSRKKMPGSVVTESRKPELRTSKSLKKKDEKPVSVKKSGILSRLKSMFRCNDQSRRRNEQSELVNALAPAPAEEEGPRRSLTVNKAREYSADSSEPVAEPPSIGAMNRFVSGRRSDAFGTA